MEKDVALHFYQLESPSPMDALLQWPYGSGEQFYKFCHRVILLFRYHLPLEMVMTLHLNIRNIREKVCHGSSIGDDHYNQMYHVPVGVAR